MTTQLSGMEHPAAIPGTSGEEAQRWAAGCGVITHSPETVEQVAALADILVREGAIADAADCYRVLRALDVITNSAMWLVVHMTYARQIRLDGTPLNSSDFKVDPQGHTGGSLNMVPAYAALLALNTLTGTHRDWLMGQGHCVAAIDALQSAH